jgi:putative phage-type endonuclease
VTLPAAIAARALPKGDVVLRHTGLGASDAAAACGVSEWKTRLQLWEEKLGAVRSEPTIPMRFGNAIESFVLELAEERIGAPVIARQLVVTTADDVLPRWATLDGVTEFEGQLAVVQAKTARSDAKWGEDGSADIPTDYLVQVHHEMLCAGVRLALVPVLFAGVEFRVYRIPADDNLLTAVTEGELEFWQYVVDNTPPPPVTLAEVNQRYSKANSGAIAYADAAAAAAVEQLREAKAQVKHWESVEERLQKEVRLFMGPAETLYGPGGEPLVTWKNQTARRLDQTRLKAEAPDVYSRFAIESESRVLRLK